MSTLKELRNKTLIVKVIQWVLKWLHQALKIYRNTWKACHPEAKTSTQNKSDEVFQVSDF